MVPWFLLHCCHLLARFLLLSLAVAVTGLYKWFPLLIAAVWLSRHSAIRVLHCLAASRLHVHLPKSCSRPVAMSVLLATRMSAISVRILGWDSCPHHSEVFVFWGADRAPATLQLLWTRGVVLGGSASPRWFLGTQGLERPGLFHCLGSMLALLFST